MNYPMDGPSGAISDDLRRENEYLIGRYRVDSYKRSEGLESASKTQLKKIRNILEKQKQDH